MQTITTFMLVLTLFMLNSCSSHANPHAESHAGGALDPNASKIKCVVNYTTESTFEKGELLHKVPHHESNPLVFEFYDLNSSQPTLLAGGAAGTTYKSFPTLIATNSKKVVMVELTPTEKNLFTYTIDKTKGLFMWSKSYQIVGIPVISHALGVCD